MMRPKLIAAGLLCVGTLLCLLPLPFIEIVSGHEAREGIRLRAMLATGEWLFPDVLRKPPLYYWLSGFVAWVRGGVVDAIALRLPSGVLAIIGALMVSYLGQSIASRKGAYWAGFILLTAPLYVQQSHGGRTDMTLCFFVTASLLFFFRLVERTGERTQSSWQGFLVFSTLACAFLAKGPVAIILVVAPILSFSLWRRDWQGFRTVARPGPFVVLFLLVGGWCALAFWEASEEFWRILIMEENVARFTGTLDRMSPLYYLGPLVGVFAPWSFLLPFAVWQAIRERQQEPGPFFLALWWITTILFFQLAAYKRARYLLPTLPPAALLVGWWISSHLQPAMEQIHGKTWWRPVLSGLGAVAGLMVIMGVLILGGAPGSGLLSCRVLEKVPGPEVARHTDVYCAWLATHLLPSILWLGAFALSLGFLLWQLWMRQYERALVSLLGVLIMLYAGLYPSWLSVTSNAASPRPYAHRLLEKLGNARSIAFINPYDEKGVPVLFALQKHLQLKDEQWPWGAPQPRLTSGYYLVSEGRRNELVSNAEGTWTEVLRDTEATGWSMTLFFHTTP